MASAGDLIRKIEIHEALKNWVIKKLKNAGIDCEELDFYDEKGDIFIKNLEDVPRALEIIKEIKEANS